MDLGRVQQRDVSGVLPSTLNVPWARFQSRRPIDLIPI